MEYTAQTIVIYCSKVSSKLFKCCIFCVDLIYLPEWIYDRKVFKLISANSNPNLSLNPNSNPKAQKPF